MDIDQVFGGARLVDGDGFGTIVAPAGVVSIKVKLIATAGFAVVAVTVSCTKLKNMDVEIPRTNSPVHHNPHLLGDHNDRGQGDDHGVAEVLWSTCSGILRLYCRYVARFGCSEFHRSPSRMI